MFRRFTCYTRRFIAGFPAGLCAPRYLLILLLFMLAGSAYAQTPARVTITGAVTDSTGRLLEGATVAVVGNSSNGTASDRNGKFVLEVPIGATIGVSFVGFIEQRFVVTATRKEYHIALKSVVASVDEVVVTAFGRKQRREALVGSVTSINPEQMKIPGSNLTNALAGQMAGVIAFQRIGQPGADNSQFFIRGVTTLGYSASPLILVDNVELSANDLARLQVDDIASFSILKDASAAALYGARGANGVILVTTKEGRPGKARINVRLEDAISKPTQELKLADPVTYMKMYNEATVTRAPVPPQFTPNDILNTQATMDKAPGSNPYRYPAVDWMKTLFRDHTVTQRANFNVSGGTDVTKYYISGSYAKDNGTLQVDPVNNFNTGLKFQNYQLRSNINVKVTKTTEVVVRLWGNFNDYTGPISNDTNAIATDLYSRALHASPVAFPAYYAPDPANANTNHILFGNTLKYAGGLLDNPYADLMRGYKNFNESRMSAQFELNQKLNFITEGLNFHGIFSTNRYAYFDLNRYYKPFYYDINSFDPNANTYTLGLLNNGPGQAAEYLSYNEGGKKLYSYIYLQGTVDYDRDFGKHNVSAAVVGTRQQTVNGNNGGLLASLPFRNLGFSGRATYAYDSRYFFEVNFGYNGSERFAPDHRWGFFPTVGGAWVVSNEKFWTGGLADIVTRLKFRGSYGLVGNDNIGSQRFFYLSSVMPNSGPDVYFGTSNGFKLQGTTIQAYPNPDVTWETSRKGNLAVELTIANKLNLTAEVYNENRYNILIRRGYIPVTAGIEGSANANLQANLGKAKAHGLDLHVDYKQDISKDFWVSVMGNLTVAGNETVFTEEPEYRYAYRSQIGQPINQGYGLIAERLFVDDKEAANSPTQLFGSDGGRPMGGDIKYRDVNGDGVINGDDVVPIGLPTTPEVIYGFGFSMGYKSFDLSAFFQGLARESFFIDPKSTAPFVNNAQLLQVYADNHWSEENQDMYALWPRLSTTDISNNQQASTWWMRDGSFMRLKSLEMGYSLPERWIKPLKVENFRIYFSGLNLLTFSSFKLWDPEQAGNGFAYPIQKVFNLGVNINF